MSKEQDGLHEALARGAAILGGAAVATGFAFHYKDLSFKGGFSNPDNLHALLGTIGALGFGYAVSRDGKGGHAGAGIIGGLVMLYGIKVTW